MNGCWWCADCKLPVDLDRHGRCSFCQSDAVDPMSRPNRMLQAPHPMKKVFDYMMAKMEEA